MDPKRHARSLLSLATVGDARSVHAAAAAATQAGLDREAVPLLRSAADRHPGDARLWHLLGLACRNLQDLEEAVGALRRASALTADDPTIWHAYARCLLEAGLSSINAFEHALRLAPAEPSMLLGLAAARFAEGRIDEAIAGLDAQLRNEPGWLEGHATAARLRWMRGDRESFAHSMEAALAAAPLDGVLWREHVNLYIDAGLHDRALRIVSEARAAVGASRTLDSLEAICWSELGEIARADGLFGKLLPFEHLNMAVRYVRHLLRAGRPKEAARLAEGCLPHGRPEVMWPYLSAAWRLLGDRRWQWLEGDARFIGVHDLAARIPSIEALARRLRTLHVATHQPLEQSVRGGTQTDGPLFSRIDPEIQHLRRVVHAAVLDYVAHLPPPSPGHPLLRAARTPIRFAGSWSVRLDGGGTHSNHVHPAGWISSAFYVALPPVVQGGERAGWLTLGEVTELGLDLPPIREVEPKVGRLVLFPSTMWHGTKPFETGERLTVAFDVAPPEGGR